MLAELRNPLPLDPTLQLQFHSDVENYFVEHSAITILPINDRFASAQLIGKKRAFPLEHWKNLTIASTKFTHFDERLIASALSPTELGMYVPDIFSTGSKHYVLGFVNSVTGGGIDQLQTYLANFRAAESISARTYLAQTFAWTKPRKLQPAVA